MAAIMKVKLPDGRWADIPALVGPAGAKGDTGGVGPQGPAGKTPVKGVDYYTPEDKAELTDIMTDTLREDAEFIEAVSEHAQLVKVAASPEFVNDISECTDTSKVYVLPNGHLCAYMQTEVVTEGETKPNFTNLVPTAIDTDGSVYNGTGYKDDTRLSSSGSVSNTPLGGSVTIGFLPFGKGDIIRVKNAEFLNPPTGNWYFAFYKDGDAFTNVCALKPSEIAADGTQAANQLKNVTFIEDNDGALVVDFTNWDNTNYPTVDSFRFNAYGRGSDLIVTINEEITYTTTEGGTEIVTQWTDTGIEYNQPPDYAERVAAVERRSARNENAIEALANRITGGSADATPLTIPAYAPPQLPADGSDGSDFDIDRTLTTQQAYDYMDALQASHSTMVVKQSMGKDATGVYDCNRYFVSKTYWKAWVLNNYPRMFAWKNGSVVIYSESVSPRIGDMMYSTGHIGTVYGAVAAVNCSTIGAASTRTVNGLVFERYADGDVKPTLVYTRPLALVENDGTHLTQYCYTEKLAFYHSLTSMSDDEITDSAGATYRRYPFADRKADGSYPITVVIWANEHGNNGDNRNPSVVLMRMVKDICENINVPFLGWLKDNAILTVIPAANPWGYDRSTASGESGYPNGNGVNLNRNYDTPGWANFEEATDWGYPPGEYAGSENETQYVMNTVQHAEAAVAISMHGMPYGGAPAVPRNSTTTLKGCGFDPDRALRVTETMWNDYECNVSLAVDELQSAAKCGKSCAYIEYVGAVGGLTETRDVEPGTIALNTSEVMEMGYTQLIQQLQLWIEEALLKAQNE